MYNRIFNFNSYYRAKNCCSVIMEWFDKRENIQENILDRTIFSSVNNLTNTIPESTGTLPETFHVYVYYTKHLEVTLGLSRSIRHDWFVVIISVKFETYLKMYIKVTR